MIAVWATIILPFTGWHVNTGNGSHTGYITAVEKTGVIWKTGRAYVKTDLSSSQEDLYCVTDEDVYKTLEQKSANKEKVTLHHHSWLVAGVTHCEGEDAIIERVE